jgi:D-alanyl-D-alanine carboxypeptidase
MKRIFNHKYLIIIGLSLLVFSSCQKDLINDETQNCTSNISGINDNHPKKAVFQNLMNSYVKKGLPGINFLYSDADGLWVGSAGLADIAKNVAMTPCHVSKVASITKTFEAVLTMKLVEEGTLVLDKKISEYLPADMISKIENADKVTLRNLLNHSTGIYDVIDDNSFYLDVVNNPTKRRRGEDILQFVYNKTAAFPFDGSKVGYSNTNTLLVSMIIDRVTGKHHEQLVREKIFTPLGLKNTYFVPEDALPNTTAQGYFDLYNNGTIVNMSNYNTSNGYGGIYSNVEDLKIYSDALLKNKTLVSPNSWIEMTKWTNDDGDGSRFGLGLIKNWLERGEDKAPIGHTGRDLGYTADMFYFPKRDATMIFFINYGTDAKSNLKPVFLEFESKVLDEIMGQ